jgi:hypothetical protein
MAARDDRPTIKRSGLTAIDRCPDGLALELRPPRWVRQALVRGVAYTGIELAATWSASPGTTRFNALSPGSACSAASTSPSSERRCWPPCVRSRHHILRGNPRRQRRGNGSIGRTVEQGRSPELPPRHDAATVADLPYPDTSGILALGAPQTRVRHCPYPCSEGACVNQRSVNDSAEVEANKRLAVRWLELVSAGDVDELCRMTDASWPAAVAAARRADRPACVDRRPG